jgi:hypothetical protein
MNVKIGNWYEPVNLVEPGGVINCTNWKPERYAGVLSAIRKEKVLLSPLRLLPSSFRIRINSGPKLVIYGVLCTTKLL